MSAADLPVEIEHVLVTQEQIAQRISELAAEIDAERAQFAVEVGAFHADPLGELADLALAQQQLLLQVGARRGARAVSPALRAVIRAVWRNAARRHLARGGEDGLRGDRHLVQD